MLQHVDLACTRVPLDQIDRRGHRDSAEARGDVVTVDDQLRISLHCFLVVGVPIIPPLGHVARARDRLEGTDADKQFRALCRISEFN